MTSHVKLKDTDKGYAALKARLMASAKLTYGTVGIHEAEGAADDNGTTVLDVATFMEFGTSTVPARSFIADYADENFAANTERVRKIARAVVQGNIPSLEAGLDRMGFLLVSEIQQRMRSGIAPELQPATIAAKGSSVPLIDTGQLWTSITHQVRKESPGQ